MFNPTHSLRPGRCCAGLGLLSLVAACESAAVPAPDQTELPAGAPSAAADRIHSGDPSTACVLFMSSLTSVSDVEEPPDQNQTSPNVDIPAGWEAVWLPVQESPSATFNWAGEGLDMTQLHVAFDARTLPGALKLAKYARSLDHKSLSLTDTEPHEGGECANDSDWFRDHRTSALVQGIFTMIETVSHQSAYAPPQMRTPLTADWSTAPNTITHLLQREGYRVSHPVVQER